MGSTKHPAGRHFLLYWQQWAVDYVVERQQPLGRIGSSHFRRVAPGDTIWIVGVARGRVHLVGRLRAAEVLSRRAAVGRTGEGLSGRYYAFAARGAAERARKIDITRLASRLRFESEHDRLDPDNPLLWPMQLQTMRALVPASARLLEQAWAGAECGMPNAEW
jgi:hypothetical protein